MYFTPLKSPRESGKHIFDEIFKNSLKHYDFNTYSKIG